MTVSSIYTCSHGDCTLNRVGKSKYCREHRAEARKNFQAKCAQDKAERADRYAKFERLAVEAHCSGIKAGEECLPTPMNVVSRMGDDAGKVYHVPEGMCGFAWVTVHPGNCSFAIWAKKNLGYSKAYGGGVQRWVNEFGQSYERKHAYAQAYAKILSLAGITAYAGSRLD